MYNGKRTEPDIRPFDFVKPLGRRRELSPGLVLRRNTTAVDNWFVDFGGDLPLSFHVNNLLLVDKFGNRVMYDDTPEKENDNAF